MQTLTNPKTCYQPPSPDSHQGVGGRVKAGKILHGGFGGFLVSISSSLFFSLYVVVRKMNPFFTVSLPR
jgi:hypothetical protein